MTMQFKNAAFELKQEPDNDGRFEGYASVFGVVDQGDDMVERGAFSKSLAKRRPKMLWQHDPFEPIGVWEEVREDNHGLFVKGRLLKEVDKGREALALLKAGAMDSMSIGYRTVESSPNAEGRVRKLLEVDLWEVSLVTFPMLLEAQVTDVKSIATEREFERVLRDAGFSRKEATAIALYGFKGLTDQRDAVVGEPDNAGMRSLLQQLTQLQETMK
jgi:HK97 family phage prohead protease